MKLSYQRINSFHIQTVVNDKKVVIGKDYGSRGRSKAWYFVEVDGKIIHHGCGTQKEAKEYVKNEVVGK